MERLRGNQERLVGQVDSTRRRLEAARPRSSAIDAVLRTAEKDIAAGGGVLAGAVAFRIFLFLVPFVFVIVGVFGVGSGAADQDPGKLAREAGISGIAAKAMAGVRDLSFTERVVGLVVAGTALFLATRALLKVLRIVHALIWKTRAGKAEHASKQSLALIGIVLLAVGLSLLTGLLRGESFVLGLIATLLYIVVPIVMWTFVSWHMPHGEIPWTALLPGAVVFGVGMQVMHIVTVYWIAHEVSSKTETYGAIGFALALLLWAYLIGRLVTTAAVVNESLWTRRTEQLEARRRRTAGPDATRRPPEGPPRTQDRETDET